MRTTNVNFFERETCCTYRGEEYYVRDNGAVFRCSWDGKRKRPLDETWTFGTPSASTGYLWLSNHQVHRIVATAFHGEPPNPQYVVHHIDSNRQNNRPENLKWLTRLENTLKDPITRKKIEYLCGSIEAFLENPSMLNDLKLEPNIDWMRTVTPEEAQNTENRMSLWAKKESNSKKTTSPRRDAFYRKTFANRVHGPIQKWEVGLDREPGLELAKTLMCAQFFWRCGINFPCCPDLEEFGNDPLDDYFKNINKGDVFAYCDEEDYLEKKDEDLFIHLKSEGLFFQLKTLKCIKINNDSLILVMCESERAKPYTIVGISLEDNGYFIHYYLGSYQDEEEANKAFSDKQELNDFYWDSYNNQMNW